MKELSTAWVMIGSSPFEFLRSELQPTMTLRSKILIFIIFLVSWGALSGVFYSSWVRGADHRDFFPWWATARLTLFEGKDPYNPDTARLMQIQLYGQPRESSEDQNSLTNPAQLLVILFPFWLVGDVEVATAIWEGFSVLLMVAALWVAGQTIDPTPPKWVILASIIWWFTMLMVFQAQCTAIPQAAIGIGLWAWVKGKDGLCGAALAFGVVKPELVLLPWIVFIIFSFLSRRWKVVRSFFVTSLILIGLSFLIAGWWLPGWLGSLQRYTIFAKPSQAFLTAWQFHPVLAVLLGGWILVACLYLKRTFFHSLIASIPLGMLLFPQTLIYNLVLMLLPLNLIWRGTGRKWAVLIWFVGWGCLFLPTPLWRTQLVLIPALTLAAVTLDRN